MSTLTLTDSAPLTTPAYQVADSLGLQRGACYSGPYARIDGLAAGCALSQLETDASFVVLVVSQSGWIETVSVYVNGEEMLALQDGV